MCGPLASTTLMTYDAVSLPAPLPLAPVLCLLCSSPLHALCAHVNTHLQFLAPHMHAKEVAFWRMAP